MRRTVRQQRRSDQLGLLDGLATHLARAIAADAQALQGSIHIVERVLYRGDRFIVELRHAGQASWRCPDVVATVGSPFRRRDAHPAVTTLESAASSGTTYVTPTRARIPPFRAPAHVIWGNRRVAAMGGGPGR